MAKGPDAFRTISEASDEVGVPQHVLRFWETKFSFIRPMKRAGGRRFYRPQDVAVLADIHRLLHQAGYTIKGVQQLHRVGGLKALSCAEAATEPPTASANESVYSQIVAPSPALSCRAGRPTQPEARQKLEQALSGLLAAKARLDALLADSHAMIQASE